jgi:hypothetical protein
MPRILVSKLAPVGLSLSATLVMAMTGCGGSGPDTSDAVVFPEPGVNVSAPAASKSGAAPSGATAASTTPAPTVAPSAPVKAEGWGTLKGQITLSGDAPAPKVLQEKGKAAKDPEYCAKDAPIVSEALIVDGATKGVKNVLVYLSKPTAVNDEAKKAAMDAKPVFDQVKCVFEPHVMAIMVDEPITIQSSDPVNHNVNVKLKNSSFNQTVAPNKSVPFTATGPERTPGPVVCDIHSWMQSYWMVLDHPYFAVTDAKGNFEIKNVPAGTQKLVVWQESVGGAGFVTAPSGDEIVIKAGDTVTKDIKIEASKLRAAQ